MHAVCAVLIASLAADAGVRLDAGLPRWLPTLRRADLEEGATYGLRRWGEGYVYDNPKFEARVARDGVVTFKDRHGSVGLSIFPFNMLPKGPGRSQERAAPARIIDPSSTRRGPWLPTPQQPPVYDRRIPQQEICPREPDSSCYVLPSANLVGVSGSFDLTDEIMRMLGQDPYRLEKARFLSATFEFRVKMAIAARLQDMKRALGELPSRLDELWGDGRYSARERRRILYELWYEMDRSPDGDRAARMIEDFIRRRLPCGAPDAYGKDELEAFDRVHPDRRFAPAADCGQRPVPSVP
jgi:hypothetical protein